MIISLSVLAILSIAGLLVYVRMQQQHKGLCISCAVTLIALLVTMTMVLAGLGALRSSIVFVVTIFIIYQMVSLVSPTIAER